MFRRSAIHQAILCVLLLPGAALAEVEYSGYVKNETAVFTKSGQVTGEGKTMLDDSGHDAGDLMKFENSARLFLNGDLGEESSWHADLNIIYDTEGVNSDYRGYKSYTQNDWLRELYVDTRAGDWDFRLGKQQVVWGTADGIKLLDIINPTDYRELVQNGMEDSRIPIWMANMERDVGESGNIQFIVSQVEENKIPGLNSDGDADHPFIMKGVDTITGQVNGFRRIAPALSNVAASFNTAAFQGMIGGVPSPLGLVPTSGLTVEGFAGVPVDPVSAPGAILLPGMPGYNPATTMPGYIALNNITQNGLYQGDPNGNDTITNLMPITGATPPETGWNPADSSSAFEYMSNATFATFNTFTNCADTGGDGCDPFGQGDVMGGITSKWKRDYPSDLNANAGFRYKSALDNGLNFSLNYFYHYSANPDVNLSWHDSTTGEKLTVQRSPAGDFIDNGTGAPGPDGIPDLADFTQRLSEDEVPSDLTTSLPTTVLLHNAAGQYYGAYNPTGGLGGFSGNPVDLRFTESLHRVHSIGTSFDYALDTSFAPIVLRGEFLYDKNDTQAVIDKRLLAIGDLSNAMKMEDADRFKYVLGADVTVLKNLLVSGQFIQFRNLDYKDEGQTCTTQTGIAFDCSKYTGDLTTMGLANGMRKDYKNKEFYSLFFSKPFGPSDEHRFNNISMYEEGGGWWNRLDVEYSFTDELIGTAEWNNYWGDENTQFGQFKRSSNLQVGIRYLFE